MLIASPINSTLLERWRRSKFRSLACLYKAERIPHFPPRIFRSHRRGGRPSELTETDLPYESNTPGADLAKQLSRYRPSDAESIPESVLTLAIRLGVEGFTDLGNSLVLTLLEVFPNALSGLVEYFTRSSEHIWLATGARPSVLWDPPSPEEVEGWGLDDHESYSFPTKEDRDDILESIATRVAYNDVDWTLRPYRLAGAVAMALDAGKVDHARQWMSILYAMLHFPRIHTLIFDIHCPRGNGQ